MLWLALILSQTGRCSSLPRTCKQMGSHTRQVAQQGCAFIHTATLPGLQQAILLPPNIGWASTSVCTADPRSRFRQPGSVCLHARTSAHIHMHMQYRQTHAHVHIHTLARAHALPSLWSLSPSNSSALWIRWAPLMISSPRMKTSKELEYLGSSAQGMV